MKKLILFFAIGVLLLSCSDDNTNSDNKSPVLVNNRLTISKGQSVDITTEMLKTTDEDNSDEELKYTISDIKNGNFTINSSNTSAFTQKDINDGLVDFKHNNSSNAPEYTVTVTDGHSSIEREATVNFSDPNNTDDYYKSITSQTGSSLKTALHNIIKGHTQIEYSKSSSSMDVWRAIERTDEDPNNSNNVILLYTGRSIPKSHKSQNNQQDYWNREHVWSKSRGNFGNDKGPGTDIHHLRATDASVNFARGNKAFDNGGSAHSEAKDCKTDTDSWEPRDAVKGDIARMMFYMAVRYESEDRVDLVLVDHIVNDKSGKHGKLSALLQWHKQDPVDDMEKRRNNIIQEIQGNRNPFIDHPEWVEKIWK